MTVAVRQRHPGSTTFCNNGTDNNGTDNNGTDNNGTDNNGTDNNGTNNTAPTAPGALTTQLLGSMDCQYLNSDALAFTASVG